MAATKRNPVEVEADRLFLVGLYQQNGRDYDAVRAAEMLNRRRFEAAREAAILQGSTIAEANATGQAAKLSVESVRRDIRIVLARLRAGALNGAAVWLDDQIAEIQLEIERTHEIDEQVTRDLEASRQRQWTRTVGQPAPPPTKKEPSPRARVSRITSHHEPDRAAAAALHGIHLQNIAVRARLRQEMRTLRFGKIWLPDPDESGPSLAAAIAGVSGPEEARALALEMYSHEIESLKRVEKLGIGPGSPELARFEAGQLARQRQRVKLLQDAVEIVDEGGSDDSSRYLIEVEVVRPGDSAEEESAGESTV